MRIRELMTTDVITIGAERLPVTDDDGGLLGIITEADFLATESERGNKGRTARLLRLFTGDAEPFAREQSVGDVMTTDLVTIGLDADHSEAARIMEKTGVKRLPVVDGSKLRGLISRADIVRAFARADHDIIEEITVKLIPEKGRLHTRTQAQLLVELSKRVDGVASVTDDLSWDQDDTRQNRLIPPIGGFPPGTM
jgi:CBS domain-containing protein